VVFATLNGWLFIDAGATGLLVFAAGLVLTWFWSPMG